jgi:ankyrin repeat protein
MSEQTSGSGPAASSLPDHANLEWLRKRAKRRLDELRAAQPGAKLADAQFDVAKEYGFSSWRALKAHLDLQTLEGQLLHAIRDGDTARLGALLDEHPDALQRRTKPYEWTLLHHAAQAGHLAVVNFLIARGLDVNARERGDNTVPMHWAAASGHYDVVRRLADAGTDVVGRGDDHALEIIGWATCWGQCEDPNSDQCARATAVADFLVLRGAHHNIYSAIALDRGDRRALNTRLTRNDGNRTPLHAAVLGNRPKMVRLLIELGADPLAVDGDGFPATAYATRADADLPVMEAVRAMTFAELDSAERGLRPPNVSPTDLLAAVALGDWKSGERLLRDKPRLIDADGGVLHLSAKRGDVAAVEWLLDHGADPSGRWAHWDSIVTPLHLAILGGHPQVVRVLLAAGADAAIPDTKHESDALGWAEFFERADIVRMLKT